MRYDTCLYKAIHYPLDSDIYIAVSLLVVQVILLNYLFGNTVDCYFVIFVFLHWIVQVEVLGIYDNEFLVWCGENAVPREFSHG